MSLATLREVETRAKSPRLRTMREIRSRWPLIEVSESCMNSGPSPEVSSSAASSWTSEEIEASGLPISWEMPAVRRPMLASLEACSSCSSILVFSVMSSRMITTPPEGSLKGLTLTRKHCWAGVWTISSRCSPPRSSSRRSHGSSWSTGWSSAASRPMPARASMPRFQ